jgi:precorrin-2 dehydrogenase/sirohydrochlorin ferrochelatase
VIGYPIDLVGLEHARCIVVGGGRVAARKVSALRQAGARPVVVSPVLCESLQRQAACGEIEVIERVYCPGDLEGAWLVIAATDEPAINEAVWREGKARGCLVNVVDDPARCNFYVPATVRRGALTISISTGGNSPALARRLRQGMEAQFDAAYGPYLALLGELRPLVRERIAAPERRKALWVALLDSDVLELLRDERQRAARQRALDIIDTFS